MKQAFTLWNNTLFTMIYEQSLSMKCHLKNLDTIITITPHLIPEVIEKSSVRNPIAVSLRAIAGSLSRYYFSIWFA